MSGTGLPSDSDDGQIVTETDRLTLRRLVPADLDALIGLHGDTRVMRFLTGRPTTPIEVQEEVLPGYLAEYGRWGGLGHWAAIERSTGDFLGWFELVPVEGQPTTLELGYRLQPRVWGKGYATEGSRAVLGLAFEIHGADRVTAQTMVVNQRSRALMERLGMRLVRTFHAAWPEFIEGAELGDVEYAMERSEWLARDQRAASVS